MRNNLLRRCPTGIPELDKILNGGFPEGSVIIVSGGPGTGKTIFSAKFLYEGAVKYGEPGVMMSFLESKRDFIKYMKTLGMDFEELEEKGLFKYIEAIQAASVECIGTYIQELIKEIAAVKAKRVVIDSISALIQVAKDPSLARELLKNGIVDGLKKLNVTSILVLETEEGSLAGEETGVGVFAEEFLADGLIKLQAVIEKDYVVRKLWISKMRGSETPYASIPFEIVPGEVIRLYPPVRLEEIPPPSREVVYKFDIEAVNEAFNGGIQKGSQIAVVAEILKSAFHLALCVAKALASKYGGRVVIRSYVHSPMTLKVLEDSCDKVVSTPLVGERCRDYEAYRISVNPTSKPLYAVAVENRKLDLRLREDFLVTGPLDIFITTNYVDFYREHANNVWLRKRLGITAFYVFSYEIMKSYSHLFNIYDYIAVLKHKFISGKPCIAITIVSAMSFSPPSFINLCYDRERGEYRIGSGP